MVVTVPLVGPSAFGVVFVWCFVYLSVCFCIRMSFIFLLVDPSAFGVVFEWFSYGCVRFSYGFNRPPRCSISFRGRLRMVFRIVVRMFLDGFRMYFIVPLVGTSSLSYGCSYSFSYVFVRFSYGFNRSTR